MTQFDAQTTFCQFTLTGEQAAEFLQGQLTVGIDKLAGDHVPTAICNLKGRVDFGLWIKPTDSGFLLILAQDVAQEFAKHVKKYAAFSKIILNDAEPCFVSLSNDTPTFSSENTQTDTKYWLTKMLCSGQSIITSATRGLFQPQELRLHQLGGVHYDKGCYLGQEVVARLWFKAAPKSWLHLVKGAGDAPELGSVVGKHVQVVNSVKADEGFVALVVARPENLADMQLDTLQLPEGLNGSVAKAHLE